MPSRRLCQTSYGLEILFGIGMRRHYNVPQLTQLNAQDRRAEADRVRRSPLGRFRLLGTHREAHHLAILDAAATTDQREADAGVADAGHENFVLMKLHRHDLAFA